MEGPMPRFGPFDSRWDALLAACPLILSQQNATAGREGAMGFDVRWRAATEYCAWLYYTPDDKYELSMLVESTGPTPPDKRRERRCRAPAFVDDKRYPSHSLRYIYFVHNHPAVPTNLSEDDLSAVVKVAKIHGKFAETKEGKVPVGVIAFFSNSQTPQPGRCDGFYEYTWGSPEVVRWTPDGQGAWHAMKAGTVTWTSDTDFEFKPQGDS